jgi:hypothetical protein
MISNVGFFTVIAIFSELLTALSRVNLQRPCTRRPRAPRARAEPIDERLHGAVRDERLKELVSVGGNVAEPAV